jgi:hypothetical protein
MVVVEQQWILRHQGILDDRVVKTVPLLGLLGDFAEKRIVFRVIIDLVMIGIQDLEIEVGIPGFVLSKVLRGGDVCNTHQKAECKKQAVFHFWRIGSFSKTNVRKKLLSVSAGKKVKFHLKIDNCRGEKRWEGRENATPHFAKLRRHFPECPLIQQDHLSQG